MSDANRQAALEDFCQKLRDAKHAAPFTIKEVHALSQRGFPKEMLRIRVEHNTPEGLVEATHYISVLK